jgi:hypothetical protein
VPNYPNNERWSALKYGERVRVGNCVFVLSCVDCGFLVMPTGRLIACDPFAGLQKSGNQWTQLVPGRYRVIITLADVSESSDGSHLREAYATLLVDEAAKEVSRRIITPRAGGSQDAAEGKCYGFVVDAGAACFVDDGALATCMPDNDYGDNNWMDRFFCNESPDCWFNRMDDPHHIREGAANITLPGATNGENIVMFHSGWGDGVYPVIGGYDLNGRLVRVHIDFDVVVDGDADAD